MYAKFFGLSQDPFSIAPDPRYLFMSERHREALAHLLYGLRGGGGFVLLSGEVGTGKTTVCRCFLEQVPTDCNVAYIFNPKLSSRELLRTICDEFHIELPAAAVSSKDFIDPLNAFLLREHAAGKSNVLIIDEAQNLSANVLEQLRLLTNLETNERKLLQIVLIGQPELRRMLARPDLEQLAQRVIARFHLDALTAPETAQYIVHRLTVAGMTGASPFNGAAVARVHKLARGVPRRINLLCDRALLGAYSSGKSAVDRRMVDKAAAEVFGPSIAPSRPSDSDSASSAASGTAAPGILSRRLMPWGIGTAVVLGSALLLVSVWNLQMQYSTQAQAKPASGKDATGVASAIAEALTTNPATTSTAAPAATLPRSTLGTTPTNSSDTGTQTMTSDASQTALVLLADLLAAMAQTPTTQNQAWQSLGAAWGLNLSGDGDACTSARIERVNCFVSEKMPLSLIRELDRPGLITLAGPNTGPTYAVLVGLAQDAAVVRIGTQTYRVALGTLAELWRGDFSTLRRAPEATAKNAVAPGGLATPQWIAEQLGKVRGSPSVKATGKNAAETEPDTSLQSRISSFQLARGLPADGVAGALTLMQLNRATGVDEPRLNAAKQ